MTVCYKPPVFVYFRVFTSLSLSLSLFLPIDMELLVPVAFAKCGCELGFGLFASCVDYFSSSCFFCYGCVSVGNSVLSFREIVSCTKEGTIWLIVDLIRFDCLLLLAPLLLSAVAWVLLLGIGARSLQDVVVLNRFGSSVVRIGLFLLTVMVRISLIVFNSALSLVACFNIYLLQGGILC